MYIITVLYNHVQLWRGIIGKTFVFMDGNAPPHRTATVDSYLDNRNITRWTLPAMSFDINPIEWAWNMLSRAISFKTNSLF